MSTPDGLVGTLFHAEASRRISTIRLVVIDESRIKADLWKHYCAHHWGFEVVGVSHSGPEGIAMVQKSSPDIVLAGLKPTHISIPDYVNGLRGAAASARVVLLTSHCTEYLVHTLRGLHYHGLIYEPDETLASIATYLERVRLGQRVISPSIVRCQNQLRALPTSFPKLLSRRHEQVLACIAHSMSDEEIGQQLGFATATALSHRQMIMKRLNIRSTPKLIRYCVEKGFNASPPPAPQKGTEFICS